MIDQVLFHSSAHFRCSLYNCSLSLVFFGVEEFNFLVDAVLFSCS